MKCILCASEALTEVSVSTPKRNALYFDCDVCCLRFLNPDERVDLDIEKSRYLEHNNDELDLGYQDFLRPLYEKMAMELAGRPKIEGLDFGSGASSAMTHMLRESGFAVEQYDPIFKPKQKVLARSYDFVVATEVIEHFFDPAKEFELLRRLVKPGGLLGMMTQILTDQIDFRSWYYRNDKTHVTFYRRKTFAWIGEKFGFTSVEVVEPNIILMK